MPDSFGFGGGGGGGGGGFGFGGFTVSGGLIYPPLIAASLMGSFVDSLCLSSAIIYSFIAVFRNGTGFSCEGKNSIKLIFCSEVTYIPSRPVGIYLPFDIH